MFDPLTIPNDACATGHLDVDAIYEVLLSIHRSSATGRLTIKDAAGDNHIFFRQGKPVGVHLAEFVHPLGQLLLELGVINGQTFVRAQRKIAEGARLAGQVFIELGVLTEDSLKDILLVQARKKAEHYCRLGSRPFTFCAGLTYLSGFPSTPMDLFSVVHVAVRAQLGPDARAAWIAQVKGMQVRIVNAAGDALGLPAAASAFGFGAAEERFLQRIVGGWERTSDLMDAGTLPADEAAVLLRFLEVIGRLERRAQPSVPAQITGVTAQPKALSSLAVPEGFDDVFSSSGPRRGGVPPAGAFADITPQSALLPAFATRAPRPQVFAGPNDATDPRRPAATGAQATLEPMQMAPKPPTMLAEELAAALKKKKVKRAEPMPSESSGALVSETRREKTNIAPMPTILVDEE